MSKIYHVALLIGMSIAAAVGVSAEIPPQPPVDCSGTAHILPLLDSKVVLTQVKWRIPRTGEVGCGTSVEHLSETGHFWFFGPENLELTCKALDGRSVNGYYWIFCGSLTDVEWWMTAIDNGNPSQTKSYYSRPGTLVSLADTAALSPGSNHVPHWGDELKLCGGESVSIVNSGSGSGFSLTAVDPDGEPLIATAHLIEGAGMELETSWTNPVSSGDQLEVLIHYSATASLHAKIDVTLTDQKSLVPSHCIVGLITVLIN